MKTSFRDLVKYSHGQHREGGVDDVVQRDEELIVHRLHRSDTSKEKTTVIGEWRPHGSRAQHWSRTCAEKPQKKPNQKCTMVKAKFL